jgi:hypothetical protein
MTSTPVLLSFPNLLTDVVIFAGGALKTVYPDVG